MRERIRKLPYRKKLLYSYFLLLFLFAVGMVFYILLQTRHLMQINMDYMDQSNQQMNLTLDMVEENAEKLRYLHFADEKMRTMLMRPAENFTPEERWESDAYIRNLLAAQTDLDIYLLRATLETADGRVYQSLVADEEKYLERLRALAGAQEWEDTSQVYYTGVYQQKINMVPYETVTMISPVYDTTRSDPVGMLYVDLDFGILKEQLDQVRQGSSSSARFAVLNREEVLYQSSKPGETYPVELDAAALYPQLEKVVAQGGRAEKLSIDRRDCTVLAACNERTGWMLVQFRPRSELALEALPDVIHIVGISAVLWAVLLALGLVFVERISRPVRLLSSVMEKAGHEKDGEVLVIDEKENVWEDEMGVLVSSYNAMARRINENIIRSYMAELEQKKTELRMLQFQINPHFLYNALNTISAIAVLENVDLIPQIANSLSEMFRYNIKGKDIVKIGDELRQAQNYLQIQEIRFPGRFDVSVEVPDELLDCGIVKFVLQPVVENSIHHGFTVKRTKDCLKIYGFRKEEALFLIVEDNGCGMPPEQTERLNAHLGAGEISELTENAKSIGLSNVNVRLKYYYGPEYGIQVESRQGEYTRIILKIRAEKKVWE